MPSPAPDAPATAPAATRTHRLLIALVLVLAAYIQFTVVSRTVNEAPLRGDSGLYFSYAWNLKHHGVYGSARPWDADRQLVPEKLVTPGYPLFLALVPGMAPSEGYVLRVTYLQALLGVASVWLAYLVSLAFMPRGAAVIVALLTALSPHLATMSTLLLTEPLFQFLLLLSILATQRALRDRRTVAALLAGLVWGACSLVRPTVLFLPALFLLAALLVPSLRAHRRAAAWLFAAFLVAQAPWQLRNLGVPSRPFDQNLVVSFLHHGSYPDFKYQGREESYGIPYRYDPDDARISRDLPSVLRHIARNFREDPLTQLRWHLVGKPLQFVGWDILGGFGDIFQDRPLRSPFLEDLGFHLWRLAAMATHLPLMLLGLAGALLACFRPSLLGLRGDGQLAARLVAAIVVYAVVFHIVGTPYPRYGIPFRALFYAMAVLPVAMLAVAFARARAARGVLRPVPGAKVSPSAPPVHANDVHS